MKLKELIKNIDIQTKNFTNEEIKYISYNSKDIKKNTLFIAIKGTHADGNEYIDSAIKKGAVAVLTERKDIEKNIPVLISKNINDDMSVIARKFYNYPDKNINIIGITGTNGKTTTSYILRNIYSQLYKTAVIGTIKHIIGKKIINASNTTPDALILAQLFNEMNKKNVHTAIMEVSSHALKLNRVKGMEFDVAIFTNLTQDHMDFHKTISDYKKSKIKLFQMLKKNGFAVINIDDKHSKDFIKGTNNKVYTVGLRNKNANWTIEIKGLSMFGSKFILHNNIDKKDFELEINLIGDYNLYNTSLAFITAYYQGIDPKVIIKGIKKTKAIDGRFEKFTDKRGFNVVVDYAHTPDALDRVIKTAKRLTHGKIITVFGCGGDRDQKKRPIMGKIASHYSDLVIITSDNPRTEDPQKIINDIVKGINENNYIIEINRRVAIKKAIKIAKKDDTVIIAGKGHEDYQIIGTKKYHFDDREEVRKNIKK